MVVVMVVSTLVAMVVMVVSTLVAMVVMTSAAAPTSGENTSGGGEQGDDGY